MIPVILGGGGTFFTAQGTGPRFGNYDVGAGVAYNFSRWVGVEGEVGGTLGISQNLAFAPSDDEIRRSGHGRYFSEASLGIWRGGTVTP
jgi:hypothetical protein